ncbi:hypothetical protein MRBLWO14_000994 [Microbacterium sp. LWO14-1.2]|uniref:hypothetical protein n=1 Tax=Microbacterium sp. LWO14-1.2 TaxID=3135263 RepID=UPI00313A3DB3
MGVKAYVFVTRTGTLLGEVTPAAGSWSENANQPETVTGVFDLASVTEGGRDWRNHGTPWKHSLAFDVGGRLLGGPIMPHNFDNTDGSLRITSRGGRILFAPRSILPPAAMPPRLLTLPDGSPDATLDSTWTGFDLGTIAKKIGQQACAWPGSDYPIVWPADRAGVHERTYAAVDRKGVDAAWTDLSKVENGPDIRLRLEWKDDASFQWRFETGTQEQPRLQGRDAHTWGIAKGTGLQVDLDPSRMGSLAWSRGGRSLDTTLIRGRYDSTLIDAGFPLLELDSDASANTVDASTLDSWNAETLRTARKPWEFWSFKVPADESPFPYEYGPGSLITVEVTKETKVKGGYVPPGTYQRRIAALSGGLDNWVTITCGENYDQ